MAINISHIKLLGVDKAPDELLSIKRELGTAPTVLQLHDVAGRLTRVIGSSGYKEVYVGRFRTLYVAILEKKLSDLGIKTLYVSV